MTRVARGAALGGQHSPPLTPVRGMDVSPVYSKELSVNSSCLQTWDLIMTLQLTNQFGDLGHDKEPL